MRRLNLYEFVTRKHIVTTTIYNIIMFRIVVKDIGTPAHEFFTNVCLCIISMRRELRREIIFC
jgi:hypothetical protein